MINFKKRCEDCIHLIIKKGETWTCDECFGQHCENIDDCPMGYTVEQVEEAENVKAPKLYAKDDSKERKPSTRKKSVDEDKAYLMAYIYGCIGLKTYGENLKDVVLVNGERELTFTYNERKFKVILSAPRS